MKFFLNHSACISPQDTFDGNFPQVNEFQQAEHHITALEPDYKPFIPLNLLRRMGKISRMGIATGLRVIQESNANFDAIISGSAYGSNEESFKFLDQIYKYDEGAMTPTNFVQSTTNVVSAQLGLMTQNHCYNSTNSQKALSFENSLIEGQLLLENHIAKHILVGAVDEISQYTFNLFGLLDWVRQDGVNQYDAPDLPAKGFVPGEGAAFFHLSAQQESQDAVELAFLKTYTGKFQAQIAEDLQQLEEPDLILSPRCGDAQHDLELREALQRFEDVPHIAYKKYFGDGPTVSACAVWLGQRLLNPDTTGLDGMHWTKPLRSVLVVNKFATGQASLVLLKR
jgi:3-oxoacyl-[acyl-carrier-protein] synthase II